MEESKKIYADDEVFSQIKDKSREAYLKFLQDFTTSTAILSLRTDTLKRRPLLPILNI